MKKLNLCLFVGIVLNILIIALANPAGAQEKVFDCLSKDEGGRIVCQQTNLETVIVPMVGELQEMKLAEVDTSTMTVEFVNEVDVRVQRLGAVFKATYTEEECLSEDEECVPCALYSAYLDFQETVKVFRQHLEVRMKPKPAESTTTVSKSDADERLRKALAVQKGYKVPEPPKGPAAGALKSDKVRQVPTQPQAAPQQRPQPQVPVMEVEAIPGSRAVMPRSEYGNVPIATTAGPGGPMPGIQFEYMHLAGDLTGGIMCFSWKGRPIEVREQSFVGPYEVLESSLYAVAQSWDAQPNVRSCVPVSWTINVFPLPDYTVGEVTVDFYTPKGSKKVMLLNYGGRQVRVLAPVYVYAGSKNYGRRSRAKTRLDRRNGKSGTPLR